MFASTWSQDGKKLATSDADGTVLWDVVTGKIEQKINISKGYFNGWSPDGKFLTGVGKVWDIEQKEAVVVEGAGQLFKWSPDGKVLHGLGSGRPGHIAEFEWPSRKFLREFPTDSPGLGQPYAAWWLPSVGAAVTKYGEPHRNAVVLPLRNGQGLAVNAEGHYRGTGDHVDAELIYVVQTAKGQDVLTPSEFADKHGWRNDPSRVRLVSP